MNGGTSAFTHAVATHGSLKPHASSTSQYVLSGAAAEGCGLTEAVGATGSLVIVGLCREQALSRAIVTSVRIAEAYVARAADKRAAIRELIELRDPGAILKASGYGM